MPELKTTASNQTTPSSGQNQPKRPLKNPAASSGLGHLGLWGALGLGLIIFAIALFVWQKQNIFQKLNLGDGWPKEPVYYANARIMDRWDKGVVVRYEPALSAQAVGQLVKVELLPGAIMTQRFFTPTLLDEKTGQAKKLDQTITKQLLPSELTLNMEILLHSPKDLRRQTEISVDGLEVIKAN